MQKFIGWIQCVLIPTLGAPGFFVVAFLDSSFLSIPEVNDLLVITAAMNDPTTVWVSIVMATLGSLAGCLLLYWIGLRSEETLLVKRFGAERTRRVREAFQRFDVLSLAVPAVLPPPAPFKIFVLAAGVFEFSLGRFVATLVVARGLRYSLWAVVGIVYREQALALLRLVDQWGGRHVAFVVASLALTTLAAILYVARRRGRRKDEAGGTAPAP